MAGKRCFVTFCALFGLCFVRTEGKPMRSDYSYYPQARGWLKLHLKAATWKDAREVCAKEGSVLASPENGGLVDGIRNVLRQYQTPFNVFTGIHDTYATGHFYSLEGTPLSRMPVRWANGVGLNMSRPNDCLLLSVPAEELCHGACDDVLPFLCFMKETEATTTRACGTADKDYKFDNRTNRCYKFHTDNQTWSDAFAICSAEGAHLAVINSDIEAQVLHELYVTANNSQSEPLEAVVFIGFTDTTGDHTLWMTIHEQTLKDAGYDKWEPGQPEDKASICGAMYGKNGKLDDFYCKDPRAYICEMEPESDLDFVDYSMTLQDQQ